MAYTEPTDRAVGYVMTADDWTVLLNDLRFLHNTPTCMLSGGTITVGTGAR